MRQFTTRVSLFLTASVVALALYAILNASIPKIPPLNKIHLQTPLRIYTQDHVLIASFGDKRRSPITFEEIPQPLIDAIVSVEDARFYTHPGVDWIAILRAAQAVLSSGKKTQGASTITMQVARNFFLTREKSYWRKIKEVLLALQIDQRFSKQEILTLYLNKIYFGNRAYGASAAAKTYYNKKVSELTLAQIAMLAGLPQAPSANNPLSHPEAALKRRNHVLARMLAEGYIDEPTYEKTIRAPITAQYAYQEDTLHAPDIAEMVRQAMLARYGETAYTRGLEVITTINSTLQRAANETLREGLLAYTLRHTYRGPEAHIALSENAPLDRQSAAARLENITSPYPKVLFPAFVLQAQGDSAQILLKDGQVATIPWEGLRWACTPEQDSQTEPLNADTILHSGDQIWVLYQNSHYVLAQVPTAEAALVSMDPHTGALVAVAGGAGFQESQFNRATQAARQTGSLFKPFIYAAALSKGFTLATLINDAPVVLKDTGENPLWRPHNDSMLFYGPTRLRQGLVLSRNLVSIRLLQSIGIPYALDYLQAFGFKKDSLPATPTLALGAASISPLDMTTAYALLAREGVFVAPFFITEIRDTQDNTVIHPNTATSSPPAPTVTPQVAFLVTSMLQDVIQHGTGRRALALHRQDIAGKTGTTNDQVDAWFAGYTPDIVTTVWVGFDDNHSLKEYGSQVALPIWIDYMRIALQNHAETPFTLPPGIVSVKIDPKTGLQANPEEISDTLCEYFREGKVPAEKESTPEPEENMASLLEKTA